MNKYFKTIASAMVTFALVLSVFATPVSTAIAVTQLDSQFGFDTSLNFGETPAYFNDGTAGTNQSGQVVYESNSSFTDCALEASRNLVTIGEGVTLYWNTTGFDTITIDGQSVSGNSGSKTIGNLRENTTFTLEALSNNGSKCVQQVQVTCVPPEIPKTCELLVEKTVNKDTALPGEKLTYTIKVQNIGDADCTGGGVRIEDVVDANVSYESYQLTSNLSAGYGSNPVYTTADRTLHFNGNVLTPGESGTITWVGKINAPAQCGDFEVRNQAKATAKELNNFQTWAYSQVVKTAIDNDCVTNDKFATVVAKKIVCTNESELPNYGNGGPDITANTAANWVASHSSCFLKSGWEFQWTDNQTNDPADNLVGQAGAPWNTFGPTDSNGMTSVKINLDTITNSNVWFREVLKDGYIPFTHGLNGGTNVDAVSAEFYCNTDVINYDNRDFISGMVDGGTYYCVAWNSPVRPTVPEPSCDMFTANPSAIKVGSSSVLTWETSNGTQVFINNGIGAVALDGSIEVSPLADIIYKLTVIGAEDKTVSCEVPVLVSNDEVPVCERFIATPNSLPYGGGTVALNWSVAKAVSATISPTIGAVSLIGSQSVNVTQPTTFILTAIDADGDQVTCPAPVTVGDKEPEPFTCANNVSFSASDYSITRGQEVTLTWSTTNVDSVSISGINATALSGTEKVSPSDDVTYTLSATKGSETVNCPVSINVSSGGGGGSSSPRCDLDISDTKIKLGEEITLKWDTSNATEITLTDDRGKVIFTTDDYLASDKSDYFDGSIKLKPTRDTKYTLLAERGSRDEECKVAVEIEDNVVVLQTRDQQPLVAGISLSQVPYTGFEAGPIMTIMFYVLLVAWAFYISYLLVIRKHVTSTGVTMTDTPVINHENIMAMKQAEAKRPDAFVAAVATTPAPADFSPRDLPTGKPAIGYENHVEEVVVNSNPHQVNDVVVTELENHAHAQKALLSSDAVRHFVGTTTNAAERNKALDAVISEAKKMYPLEDGWIVINESRMQNLCTACQVNKMSSAKAPFIPATVPEGTGSLAEAIVTGNVVAAYAMIGNRPMFALADAAADLDAIYRKRQGAVAQVSDMLIAETKDLSDQKIKNMIDALTGALDGTYTDEASAVKMAIMKAVKEAA